MRFVILSLSASEHSVSRACVPALTDALDRLGHSRTITDVRDLPPVWSRKGGISVYPEPYQRLYKQVEECDGIFFFMPIYCYTASGPTKILSEILGGTGGALTWKPAAFVVASGTARSHLAVRDLMASMAFEQQTLCYPQHVQVMAEDLDAEKRPGAEPRRRIELLARGFCRFAQALGEQGAFVAHEAARASAGS